jgi:hypothetical protein
MVEGADEFQRFQSSGERKNVKLAVPVRQGCELPLIWIFRGDLLLRVVYISGSGGSAGGKTSTTMTGGERQNPPSRGRMAGFVVMWIAGR